MKPVGICPMHVSVGTQPGTLLLLESLQAGERESERGSSCPFVRGGARVPVTVLLRAAHARASTAAAECTVKGTSSVAHFVQVP